MNVNEVKVSFLIVWLIISLVILITLIAPFVFSSERLASLTPTCEWKAKYHRECILCGMTTSFILISRGNFTAALSANRASLALYLTFVANQISVLLFLGKVVRQGWRLLPRDESVAIKTTKG